MNCSTIGKTILTATILFGSTSGVRAECVRSWKDAADAERRSTLVFSGTVVARRLMLPLYIDLDAFRLVERTSYLMFADQLSTGDPRASRGPTETEPMFYISSCSASRQLTNVNERVQELGKPHRPRK